MGALSAIWRANSWAADMSSATGTTRSTRPMRIASAAGTRMPVRIISRALPRPTRRGRRWVPPPPGMMARLISVRPSCASSAAIRISQARASSRPPPRAKPRMAAMMGCAQRSISARKSSRLRDSRKWVGVGGSRNSRMSAPAQKARSPAPVMTTTLTVSSVRSRVKISRSWPRMALFMALSTSGRSRVRVRMPSFASERTGSSELISALASPLSGLRPLGSVSARIFSALASPLSGLRPLGSVSARIFSALASPLSRLRPLGSVSARTSEILSGDDAAALEVGDLVVAVARLPQDGARVLAEQRWRSCVRCRRVGEADGLAHEGKGTELGVLVLHCHLQVLHTGIAHELLERLHGRAGDVVVAQDLEPLLARLGGERRLEDRHQRVAIVTAKEPGAEARVVDHLGSPDGRAELGPEGLVAAGEEEPLPVPCLVEAIGRCLAQEGGLVGIVDHAARLEREHALEERGLHDLAASRALAHEQRGEHGLGAQGRRVVIGDGHPHELRRPAEALEVLDAAERLEYGVVAGTIAIGPVGPEGGHGAVDQARVQLTQGGRVHAEPLVHARAHVLHEHVRRLHEAVEHLLPGAVLQVHGDGALAAVPPVEAGQLPEGITLQRLDLDHARSHVGEHHGTVGAGEVRGAVQHRDAVEGAAQVGHQRAEVRWRTISSRWNSASPKSGSRAFARFM